MAPRFAMRIGAIRVARFAENPPIFTTFQRLVRIASKLRFAIFLLPKSSDSRESANRFARIGSSKQQDSNQNLGVSRPKLVIFFFPYNPPPPLPRQTPRPSHPEKLDFGPFWLRLAPFRLRLAPFGSVSAPFRAPFRVRFGVSGGVEERGFCKGKEYH